MTDPILKITGNDAGLVAVRQAGDRLGWARAGLLTVAKLVGGNWTAAPVSPTNPVPVSVVDTVDGPDFEFSEASWRCKTAFAGAGVGDLISRLRILQIEDGEVTQLAVTWRNETTDTILGGAPASANLELIGASGLTLAQIISLGLMTATKGEEIRAILAGVLTVSGTTSVVSQTPVVATGAYSSGHCIGGLMTFAGMARVAGGKGMIQMASIHCKSTQTFASDLVLFHTNPSASTFTDHQAIAIATADFDKILGVVHISDWTNLGVPSFAQATQLAMAYGVATGQTDIFAALVSRGTPTLASTSDVRVVVKSFLD